MKMLKKALFISIALLVAVSAGAGKKTALLNPSKGEQSDPGNNCLVALSEDFAEKEGEFTQKVEFTGRGWTGQFKPKKGSWTEFSKLRYVVYNPSDKPVKSFGFAVKGAKMSNGPENRRDFPATLPPGKSEHVVELKGQLCNDGKSPLDTSSIFMWDFWNYEKDPVTVYIIKATLEE